MKGKWKVIYNPMIGYIVARVKNTDEAVHSGNLEYYGDYSDDKSERQAVADELNTAEALEKQIPKKPNKTIDSSWGVKKEVHVCPVCDYYLTEVHFIAPQKIESNKKITYCETCGQAIDWSDEE